MTLDRPSLPKSSDPSWPRRCQHSWLDQLGRGYHGDDDNQVFRRASVSGSTTGDAVEEASGFTGAPRQLTTS